jgi:hypothetical protein
LKPATDKLVSRPDVSQLRNKPEQDVQVIVEHGEATDSNREIFSKQLQTIFDPLLAIGEPLPMSLALRRSG